MNLYPIERDLLALFGQIDAGEVDAEAAADTLEALSIEYEAAVDDAATRVKELRGEAELLKAEVANLQDRLAQKTKQADRYLALIFESMKRLDQTKIESTRNVVQVRRTPPKVVIADEDAFGRWAQENAPNLVHTTVLVKPDRVAIKRAIDGGAPVEGVRIEQGESLQIK